MMVFWKYSNMLIEVFQCSTIRANNAVTKVKVARYGPNLDCQYDYSIKFGCKDETKIIECMPVVLTGKIPSKHLVERSKIFRANLINLAHQRHFAFLK